MSLLEIFHKVQGWLGCGTIPFLEGRCFFAALIISAIAAIIALAVSATVSGNGKDNSDAPRS
jgi:hypothetical protein